MLLYYITDRTQLTSSPEEAVRQHLLLEKIAAAAAAGVDFIQLRERDLPARELERLGRAAMERIQGTRARLLINSRMDVAIAAGAAGVHLRSDDLSAADARAILEAAGVRRPVIGVSCHSAEEVQAAGAHGADFAVFGPVFEKDLVAAAGLEQLRSACRKGATLGQSMPVLALGGVTRDAALACIRAGASGVAGIRLFQGAPDLDSLVAGLRALGTAGPPCPGKPEKTP